MGGRLLPSAVVPSVAFLLPAARTEGPLPMNTKRRAAALALAAFVGALASLGKVVEKHVANISTSSAWPPPTTTTAG